jgi:hypothetical protein
MKAALLVGAAAAAALVLVGLAEPRAALAGWLAALAAWSGVPLGALLLTMIAVLTPGRWREEVGAQARALLPLLPLAALAMLPVLIGMHLLYPWTQEPGRLYLTPAFFALRSVLFLTVFIAMAAVLLLRADWALPLSAGGLILFVLVDTSLAVDWLMSLQPDYHSSGFGLYVLAIQANAALAVIVLFRLRLADARPGLLGALLMTALLTWAYLAFMQYIISWSDNLPEPVAWYRRRGAGIWSAAEFAIGALRLAPLILLLLNAVRENPRWLRGIAVATLLATAIETAWLVFPATGTAAGVGAATELLALAVLASASAAFYAWVARSGFLLSRRSAP